MRGSKRLLGALRPAPLSYFWALEYWDGQALSQFDAYTGKETLWADVLKKNRRIKTVLWMPFSPEFAKKVQAASGEACRCLPTDRMMIARIPEGGEIIIKRKARLKLGLSGSMPAVDRVYLLGFKYGDEVFVMARDGLGRDISPAKVARWAKEASKTDHKGMLAEKE